MLKADLGKYAVPSNGKNVMTFSLKIVFLWLNMIKWRIRRIIKSHNFSKCYYLSQVSSDLEAMWPEIADHIML